MNADDFKKLSAATQRKYKIIAAIAFSNSPTMKDIIKATGIPEPTVKRQLSLIRSDFNMDVRFVTEKNTVGRGGHYHIYSWGMLNRSEFVLEYQQLLTNDE